jgi:hypothetical protein
MQELFNSYQSFSKSISAPLPVHTINRSAAHSPKNDREAPISNPRNKTADESSDKVHASVPPVINHVDSQFVKTQKIREVDMTSEEIIAIAMRAWNICPQKLLTTQITKKNRSFRIKGSESIPLNEEISSFLSGVQWE